MKYSDAA